MTSRKRHVMKQNYQETKKTRTRINQKQENALNRSTKRHKATAKKCKTTTNTEAPERWKMTAKETT